jgi:hypothetical protein
MERNMKKRNWLVFQAILMILAVLVFASVFSCKKDDDGPKVGNVVGTFTGTDTNGKVCTLQINDDDTYEFFIDGTSVSTGTAAKNGDTYTLTANGGGEPFTVTVKEDKITEIKGAINPDDGSKPIPAPEMPPPYTAVAGKWNWFASDDSKLNGPDVPPANVNPQTIFEPGGVSKITNAVPIEGEDGSTPFVYPEGTVKDNDDNTITVPVFNFTGNTKVDPNKGTGNSAKKNFGAGWPLVGWEAQPADEETAALLKTAYGYSFWVRLNSSLTNTTKANDWAFLTAIVTDFTPEKGYEYKHWFGNKPGDSGGSKINNFTKDLNAGTWYKITVIMDASGRNIEEDKWLFQWPPSPDPKKPFNQSAAEKIQWQIPLQHNGGAQRNGDPYDMISGSFDFNLDFYGLELLTK